MSAEATGISSDFFISSPSWSFLSLCRPGCRWTWLFTAASSISSFLMNVTFTFGMPRSEALLTSLTAFTFSSSYASPLVPYDKEQYFRKHSRAYSNTEMLHHKVYHNVLFINIVKHFFILSNEETLRSLLLYKAKRQYLLTWYASSYYLLALYAELCYNATYRQSWRQADLPWKQSETRVHRLIADLCVHINACNRHLRHFRAVHCT